MIIDRHVNPTLTRRILAMFTLFFKLAGERSIVAVLYTPSTFSIEESLRYSTQSLVRYDDEERKILTNVMKAAMN